MKEFGFSLLELLVVIAISSILAVVGIGSWQDIKLRNELCNTTRYLMRFLNELKVDANFYNTNHTIHLFRYSPTSWCLAVTNEKRPHECHTHFHFHSLNGKVEIAGLTESSSLAFYGRRNTAQTGTIKLKNAIGESRIIISARGRIRYCSYHTYLSGFVSC